MNDKNKAYIFIFFSFILLIVITILSETVYEGADNINHYTISRYSFAHPYLLLDHWGKPFFTLISSLFSQFGFWGLVSFNIVTGLATSFIAFRISQELKYKNSFLVIPLVLFAPYYFVMQMTALAEVFFSFVLVSSVYLIIKKRYLFSALLLSFLPFVRNEGIVIMPVFILLYFILKQHKIVPFIFTGFILYSFIGYFYYNDFFWLINKMPYKGAVNLYGHGTLIHFIQNFNNILGTAISVLFISGSLTLLIHTFFKRERKEKEIILFEWLILSSFVIYFSFHSLLWWKGWGGSMGLLRVIAGISPFASIIGLKGFDILFKPLENKKKAYSICKMAIILIVFSEPFLFFKFPMKRVHAETVMADVSEWLKSSDYKNKKVYYYDPYYQLILGFDPYDQTDNQWMIHIAGFNMKDIETDGILIWDSHFGPSEGQLQLHDLMTSKEFELINIFYPSENFTINGKYYYNYIFLKVPFNSDNNNDSIFSSLKEAADADFSIILTHTDNFEEQPNVSCDTTFFHTGKKSFMLTEQNPYSPGLYCKLSTFMNSVQTLEITASVFSLCLKKPESNKASLVISIENNGNAYFYSGLDFEKLDMKEEEWNNIFDRKKVSTIKSLDDELKAFVWYRGKDTLLIDDLKVKVYAKSTN